MARSEPPFGGMPSDREGWGLERADGRDVIPPRRKGRPGRPAYDDQRRLVTSDYLAEREREIQNEGERTLELREEELIAHKEMRDVGEVRLRTVVEEVPSRLEVEALREEVDVEHVPVGEFVSERREPWEENGVLVVPVYEEQVVVTKRLLLREHLRIRRVPTTESRVFEDTVKRERLIIEEPEGAHLLHERFEVDDRGRERRADEPERHRHEDGGLLGRLVRKAIE